MIKQVLQALAAHPLSHEKQQHASIDAAAARTHRQPVERGEGHGSVDAYAVAHGAEARAAAKMRDHDPAVCQVRRATRQFPSDIFIGQAMEAVAPDASRHAMPAAGRSGWPHRRGRCESAVSKQATCGRFGCAAASDWIAARLCGWCKGASGTSARRSRITASSTITGAANRVPPCTTRWPAATRMAPAVCTPIQSVRRRSSVARVSSVRSQSLSARTSPVALRASKCGT